MDGRDDADLFDHHMNEGWSEVLEDNKPGALEQIQSAVYLNPRNVYALLLCAVLKCILENLASARGYFESAAMQLESFTRAKVAGAYPYTRTSNDVYERILGVMIPVALHRAPGSVLKGSVAVVSDETLVRSFVQRERLNSKLPAFCLSQVETILDQTVHATVTFSSEIYFARETTSTSTGWRNGYQLKLNLKLMTAEFGVKGCLGATAKSDALNHGNLLGYQVYDFRIVASPGESWASDCKLSSVRPGDEHNNYPIQHTKNSGYIAGVNLGASIPTATLQANYMDGRTVSSPLCGWVQSSKVGSSGNDWGSGWILSRFRDGHEIALDKPVRKIRELPIADPCNVNYSPLGAAPCCYDATWTIPLDKAKEWNFKFDFKITVKANVVLLPRWRTRDLITVTPPKPITDSVSFSSTIHCQYFDSVVKLYHGPD